MRCRQLFRQVLDKLTEVSTFMNAVDSDSHKTRHNQFSK